MQSSMKDVAIKADLTNNEDSVINPANNRAPAISRDPDINGDIDSCSY